MDRFAILDRDGTLTRDEGYTFDVADFQWMPGAIEMMQELARLRFAVFLASNQSGIGRGYFSVEDMEIFNDLLVESALESTGLRICSIAVCPHTPSEFCSCRKPQPGLFEAIIEEHSLTNARGFAVGNAETDIAAAKGLDLPGLLVPPDGVGTRELCLLRGISDRLS